MAKNVPQEPGQYYIKSGSYAWWNGIANVVGEAPFLRVDTILSFGIGEVYRGDIKEWGPKLSPPPDEPNNDGG